LSTGKRAAALARIRARYGSTTVAKLASGSRLIDEATGGGWPRGEITELTGNPASGKSTLVLSAIAAAQRQEGTAVLVDLDHSFMPDRASALGVKLDPKRLVVLRPEDSSTTFSLLEPLIASGAVALAAIDSIAPLDTFTPGLDDQDAAQRRASSIATGLRQLLPLLTHTACSLLIIDQYRLTCSNDHPRLQGTAGVQLPRLAALRLELRGIRSSTTTAPYAHPRLEVRVMTDRHGAPTAAFAVPLQPNHAFWPTAELLSQALIHGIIHCDNDRWLIGNRVVWQAGSFPEAARALEAQLDTLTQIERLLDTAAQVPSRPSR
jgi:recombination protein RecA